MTSEMNPPLTLLVLAAGLGSRYGGLKQLEKIGPDGETLMDYSIYDARRAGFTRVIFLIREEMREQFESQVGEKYRNILDVEYAYQNIHDLPSGFNCPLERIRPWGTGHAVWSARKSLVRSDFAVINADDFYGFETFQVLAQSFGMDQLEESEKPILSMVGFRLSETLSEHGLVSRGICQETAGYLETVEEWSKIGGSPITGLNSSGTQLSLSGSELVSMNIWGFPGSIFSLLETEFIKFLDSLNQEDFLSEFYLPSAVDASIKSGSVKVKVYPASCAWMGVTFKEDKTKVMDFILSLVENGIYRNPLFED
tara:strand:- start:562 stop:1494 length:933 start_codon:yes stop_codon:yes gene_type:complete